MLCISGYHCSISIWMWPLESLYVASGLRVQIVKASSTRMHSSRMHTARSLTASHSIPWGGLPNPPRCRPLWMQIPLVQTPPPCRPLDADPLDANLPGYRPPDADPPGCRSPQMQTPRCRPPGCWPPRCRPPGCRPPWSCDQWCILGSQPSPPVKTLPCPKFRLRAVITALKAGKAPPYTSHNTKLCVNYTDNVCIEHWQFLD